jgi:hypothetical protein
MKDRPSEPGIIMSVRIKSGVRPVRMPSASDTLWACCTSWPLSLSISDMAKQKAGSSSTTSTVRLRRARPLLLIGPGAGDSVGGSTFMAISVPLDHCQALRLV